MVEKLTTIKDINNMNAPSKSFYVSLEDNIYGIRFKAFKIRDVSTKEVFHEFSTDDVFQLDYFADNLLNYQFPYKMLRANSIGTNLTLVVGDKLVKDLDFIEKHYIEGELVKSFEFNFPVFLPKSTNSIEFIYDLPKLNDDIIKKIKENEDINAFSDTFIFVEGNLVIHRRASYKYSN